MEIKKDKVALIERGVVEQANKRREYSADEIKAAAEAAKKTTPTHAAAPRRTPAAAEPVLTDEEQIERGIRILREEARTSNANVTMRMYEVIQPGCSADLAFRILGMRCQELSRSDIGGVTTSYYMWQNADGSNLSLMFQNGSVAIRGQFGLK
jgi:hypothetical protein